ncbi:MAG: hypothetical protein P8X43_15305 [Maritimibacter sp.]
MPNQASGNELAAMLRFEPVAPSVRGRTYAAGRGSFANLNLIAIVTRGSASLIRAGETLNILSHSVMVLPHGAEAELQVPAGTRAWLTGFARPLQSLIVGTGAFALAGAGDHRSAQKLANRRCRADAAVADRHQPYAGCKRSGRFQQ